MPNNESDEVTVRLKLPRTLWQKIRVISLLKGKKSVSDLVVPVLTDFVKEEEKNEKKD